MRIKRLLALIYTLCLVRDLYVSDRWNGGGKQKTCQDWFYVGSDGRIWSDGAGITTLGFHLG